MTTILSHGTNAKCPKVLSGEWKYCQGHIVPDDFDVTQPRNFAAIHAGEANLHSGIVAAIRAAECTIATAIKAFEAPNGMKVREVVLERYRDIGETLAGVHLRVTSR